MKLTELTTEVESNLLIRAEKTMDQMRIAEALSLFYSAERAGFDPDRCCAGRWTCHMLTGDFEKAWMESDRIFARGNPDPHRFWNGKPLAKSRVLVRCLHGLGDTIQFIRYAPLIREESRSLTLEVQPTLKALISASGLADHVITWGDPEPEWDQQVEIIEVPRIFRTELSSIPKGVPYLRAPVVTEDLRSERSRPRVGLVWCSSRYNPARSIEASALSALFEIEGVDFYSLQAGPERFELAACGFRVQSLFEEDKCVLATATTLQALDLVITVDTMMAHLAGALARPVWTLLPFQCDWRWMLERDDSPWYPSMRLFRQRDPGKWAPVLDRVKGELEQFSNQFAGPGNAK